MALKLLFDPVDGTILGAQAVGRSGVDKRIDVLATAITGDIPAGRLADLELAYAPPFSSAKDPVNLLGYMAENILSGECDVADSAEVATLAGQGWLLLDVRGADEHAPVRWRGPSTCRSTNCGTTSRWSATARSWSTARWASRAHGRRAPP